VQTDDIGSQDLPLIEEASLFPTSVRSKCMTQLLFLGAVDSLQVSPSAKSDSMIMKIFLKMFLKSVVFQSNVNCLSKLSLVT
jgi:hypothetical protein